MNLNQPRFDNTYRGLPDHFYEVIDPTIPPSPSLLKFNYELASELGFKVQRVSEDELARLFSGSQLPQGAQPIALAYAGHQFGQFVPQLGDGRAVLLGEVVTAGNIRYDIQLKGAGRTRFSRGGDGRSVIGPVLREYVVSEAMHNLGVKTSRALAAVSTGEKVYRERGLPGAVLTRVASSHIRIGTFQYFSSKGDVDSLKALADYAISRHYPGVATEDNPYLSFFREVIEAQASLIAQWMSFGFIHGVMNTDNTTISGETIDYGPCAFMDNFSFRKVFSSIDEMGRYAYINQPGIAQWNLARLGDCLVPLIDQDRDNAVKMLESVLESYSEIFQSFWLERMSKKLGFINPLGEDDDLVRSFMQVMEQQYLDFTLAFRTLPQLLRESSPPIFQGSNEFQKFKLAWLERVNNQGVDQQVIVDNMNSVNPLFIARNHQIEHAIQESLAGSLSIFNDLVAVLTNPFSEQPDYSNYSRAPEPENRVQATFCGT